MSAILWETQRNIVITRERYDTKLGIISGRDPYDDFATTEWSRDKKLHMLTS